MNARHTEGLQNPSTTPPNAKPEYTLEEIATFYVGELTTYQKPPKTRTGTHINDDRRRELHRHLVSKTL